MVAVRGKGSHGRLYFGERFTTVKDRRQELKKGLLHAMIKQLGLEPNDFF
ncbi:MAG TPA: type II toxin-antitoxin system HicA family toxin [Gammaproteobacteria bacterium]|nr:type II toxin-antitoxin system HicA family toxin [Gammaproteobacteria bacterium]